MQLVTMQFYFLMLFLPVLSNTTNDFFGLTRSKRGSKTTFLEKPECSNMKRFCEISNDPDDLSVLECLHSLHPNDLAALTPQCQQIVWEKTNQLIKDESILELLFPVCRIDMTRLNCKIDDGDYFKCLASGKDNIEDKSCLEIIGRVENVAFTDYKFLAKFLYHCESDVQELKCGKIDSQDLSQIKTIACLQSNILQVTDNCKREVFRLSELQSDNIKLDQQLYMDCVEDYSKYCSQFVAGSGRVFHCLLRQDPQKLSSKCKESLSRREKLISQDYKISRGLMRACKEDIKKSHCRKQTSNDKTVRLAQILLCLENIVKNGSRIVPDCEAELVEHRRMLMEDYRLSPEIVDKCKKEISVFCKGFQTGGNTIHCLMKHAREKDDTFGKRCQAALEDLIKQTDVGENWNVDPVLHKACSPVVTKICKDITSGEARVINCLMDNIGAYYMTEDCEDALIQIQYFISRRFELDDQLYRACKADATRLCHVSSDWDSQGESGSGVLPCLFRYVDPEDRSLQVNRSCLQNIRRVMRQRALSVDLEPAIEESCLSDLGTFCHDRVAKGEEMKCLQEKYNSLEDKCRETIGLLTEFQAEHIELNPYIKKFCSKIMDDLCSKEATHDEGDVMECLISHKNDPVVKANQACKGSIEHFQLISLNDYKFSYKFKVACKPYAVRFCSNAHSKNEVVRCLSEHVLNATVIGIKTEIPRDCKQQLKAQLFQQRENINYDPVLKAACSADINKYCSHVSSGNAQDHSQRKAYIRQQSQINSKSMWSTFEKPHIHKKTMIKGAVMSTDEFQYIVIIECLKSENNKLSNKCEMEVFKVKKQGIDDNSLDYALMTKCSDAIEQFCSHHDKENVFECLKKNKDEKGFSKKCQLVVIHRIVEQNSNYQLNPSLQHNCNIDINKFCSSLLGNRGKETNGVVIKCLKEQFKLSRLSNKCEKELASILREQALNINLNPLIRTVCKNELLTICKSDEGDDTGDTEECLKNALLNSQIQTPECKVEVANMIEESQADIQVDPILQQACALDLLNYCNNVPQGNGRHINCLKIMLDNNKRISPKCKNLLRKRLEMYKNAAVLAPPALPEDLSQLYNQVVSSPSKQYFFLVVITFLGAIFMIGILCGRLNRRKYMLLKSK